MDYSSKLVKMYQRIFPEIEFTEQYVDACAMNLIRKPDDYDIILTTNMFGDILSDEALQVAGSIGMGPAGNIGRFWVI